MHTPIAITGVGVLSPTGITVQDLWRALLGQADLGGPWAKRTIEGYPVNNVVSIPESLWSGLPVRHGQSENRAQRMASFTVQRALEDAGLRLGERRVGCILGTTTAGVETTENHVLAIRTTGHGPQPGDLDGASILPAGVGDEAWRGPSYVISNACSSGLVAPALAIDALRCGETDAMIAGGVDVLLEYTICGFNGLRLASDERGRPFDAHRKGVVLSEGAVCFCLEPLQAARERGAHVKAVITGFGMSCDAEHVTAPNAQGVSRAIRQALGEGGHGPNRIGAVFTHGTGTLANDATEVAALRAVFGETPVPPLTSIKSVLGHSQAAAGAFSLLAAVLALEHGLVPPTAGLRGIDPSLMEIDVVHGEPRMLERNVLLVNAFGFGGNNCVMAVSDETTDEFRHRSIA